jgi:hypothetical protein
VENTGCELKCNTRACIDPELNDREEAVGFIGLLGFVIEGVFNLQSSFMDPIIVGAIAGVVPVLITIALFRNGKADQSVRILPRTTPALSIANPV